MNTRNLIYLFSAITGVSTIAQNNKPNIVFILTDDMGINDLGCYGNDYIKTPNIDALAKGGIQFTQSYSSSPVSSPSRAALLTGKHPAQLQITNFLVGNRTDPKSPIDPAPWKPYLSGSERTIAEILKENGYRTGIVGKWHVGEGEGQRPWEQGFDFTRKMGKNGLDYYNYSIQKEDYSTVFEDHGTDYLTDKLTEYAMEFIESTPEKQPFYLYLTYTAPHVLIVPKAGTERNYMFNYNNKDLKSYRNPYYAAMVTTLDEGVGKVIETLRKTGDLENTIIVFTSDNGGVVVDELGFIPTSMLPWRDGKGHCYEGGIRVPAIVSWKKEIPAGKVSDYAFTNLNYFPTLLKCAGIDYSADSLAGKNMYNVLISPENKVNNEPMFWHYPHFSNQGGRPQSAVRMGDYKLVENYETGKLELFNLINDKSETKNLARKNRKKTNEMYQLLSDWKQVNNVQLPVRKSN